MTWEQFEMTGAVKDYLSYKGIAERVQARTDRIGPESIKAQKETEHGTDNYSDRHDPGSISVQ